MIRIFELFSDYDCLMCKYVSTIACKYHSMLWWWSFGCQYKSLFCRYINCLSCLTIACIIQHFIYTHRMINIRDFIASLMHIKRRYVESYKLRRGKIIRVEREKFQFQINLREILQHYIVKFKPHLKLFN